MPRLPNYTATARSYGIQLLCIAQSLVQTQERWGEKLRVHYSVTLRVDLCFYLVRLILRLSSGSASSSEKHGSLNDHIPPPQPEARHGAAARKQHITKAPQKVPVLATHGEPQRHQVSCARFIQMRWRSSWEHKPSRHSAPLV